MKRRLTIPGILALGTVAFAWGCHDADHGHGGGGHDHSAATAPTPTPAGLNPVQHEMRLLEEAIHLAVTGVANAEVAPIPEALHRVHGARMATEAALEGGSYRPPKNGSDVQGFVQLDQAFHRHLEQLVGAAQANDVDRTAAALATTIQSCHGCHQQYRF